MNHLDKIWKAEVTKVTRESKIANLCVVKHEYIYNENVCVCVCVHTDTNISLCKSVYGHPHTHRRQISL